MTLPATGYVPPRLAEIRQMLEDNIRDEWGKLGVDTGVDLSSRTILGQFLDVAAARLDEYAEDLGSAYNAFDPENAVGVYCDALGDIVGIPRLEASKSVVILTVTGTAGATLAAGKIARDVDTKIDWILGTVTFDGAGNGTVNASPAAYGPITAVAGKIAQIVTSDANWATVTNADVPELGRLREEDSDYMLRRRQSLQVSGSGSCAAIAARVRAIATIKGAKCVDNPTLHDTTISGWTIPSRTLLLLAYPLDTATDEVKQKVATTIWAHKPPGTGTMGSYSYTVTDDQNMEQIVQFDEPVKTAITVTINASGTPLETDIETQVLEHFNDFNIGEMPTIGPLLSRLLAVDGVTDILSITYAPNAVDELELAVTDAAHIIIT